MSRPAYLIGSALFLTASVVALRVRPSFALFRPKNSSAIMGTTSTASTDKLHATEKKDSKFWDKIADSYSKKPIDDEESYKKKLAITQEYFRPHMKALEFGCGTGGTSLIHAPHVKHIDAIDFSSEMIQIAKNKAEAQGVKNVDFQTLGIDRFNAPDETYDAVLGLNILHLLPNKDEVITKVHKMLKPGGVFVSSSVCMGDFVSFFKVLGPPLAYFGVLPKLNVFKAEELKESLTSAGFEIEREFQPSKKNGLFLVAKKI